MTRPIRFLFVVFSIALGCTQGSAFCKWAQANNVAVVVENGQGASWDVCNNTVQQSAQAVEPDAGPSPGFCDPSSPPSLDTDCSKCMKAACCAELTACAPDASCICHAGIDTGVDCSGSAPDDYTALQACYAAGCPMCARLP
jgi:hypothetical protein